jgi:hypothetical protein
MHEYNNALGQEDDCIFDSRKLILLEAKVQIEHRKDIADGDRIRANVYKIQPLSPADTTQIKAQSPNPRTSKVVMTPDDFNDNDCPF